MTTPQQQESLKFFKENADAWALKSTADGETEVNIVKQRNNYVLKVMGERAHTVNMLDVGCGTGDLVCEAVKRGVPAVGVDFADEMIVAARALAVTMETPTAKFETASIFDFACDPESFDLIAANGFIEYISYTEFDQFLAFAMRALKPGGSLVMGSRNRLYNIFSVNNYTQDEINEGNATPLFLEAVAVAQMKHVNDLLGFATAPLQKETRVHGNTGIDVATRYQFTPAQLVNKLHGLGFVPREVYPLNIHAVPPAFRDQYPALAGSMSNLLQQYADSAVCLIPQSSSFMIHVQKA